MLVMLLMPSSPDLKGFAVLLLCQILSCILGTHKSCQDEEDACCALSSHAQSAGEHYNGGVMQLHLCIDTVTKSFRHLLACLTILCMYTEFLCTCDCMALAGS